MRRSLYIAASVDKSIAAFPDRIQRKIRQKMYFMSEGHFSDVKALGEKLFELRIHTSPGFRIYFCFQQDAIYILHLGTKATQKSDIERLKEHLKHIEG